MGQVDEISVYLGYEVRLNRDLQLRLPVRNMRFFSTDYISEEDLDAVRCEVVVRENEEFAAWLSMWSPWESVLQRQNAAGYEKMQKNLYRKGERKFQNQLAKAIRDFGAGDDEYVRRLEGPRIMKKIEGDIKLPLTRDFLKSRHKLSLLDEFWNAAYILGESKKHARIAERLDR